MDTEVRKFQTLELNQTYLVQQYDTELIEGLYGDDYYILRVSKGESDESFKLKTTPLLCKYIKERKPTEKFKFIVKEKKGNKYPFIEGYSKERKWFVLE